MTYLQEVVELATHYPYSYDTCEYVYLSHGSKAEDILKVGAERHLSSYWVIQLSDLCLQEWVLIPSDSKVLTDTILKNIPCPKREEDKLPKKLRNGWK